MPCVTKGGETDHRKWYLYAKCQDSLHDEKLRQQKKAIKQYNSAVFQAATL